MQKWKSIILFVLILSIVLVICFDFLYESNINFSKWSHPQKNDVYEEMFTEERIKIAEAGPDSVLYYKRVNWALDGEITLKMSKKRLKENYRRIK